MREKSEAQLLHQMATYCSAAERCVQDVEKKLQAAGLPEEAARRIVDRLVKERFLDESRFARAFVSDKLRFNKWGRIKIAYELVRKGIPSPIRTEALGAIDETLYASTLIQLLKDKKKSLKGTDRREAWLKLSRFAAGRGFEPRETSLALKELFNGNDYEEAFD